MLSAPPRQAGRPQQALWASIWWMRLFQGFLPYDEQNGWQKLQTLLEAHLPVVPGSRMLSAPHRQAGRPQQALWASIRRMRLFQGFLPYDEQNGWQKLQTLLEAHLPAVPGSWMLSAPHRQAGRPQQALWASIRRMRLFQGFLPYDEQNGWQKLQTLLEAHLPAGPGSWMLSAPQRPAGRGQSALWASIWRRKLFEGFLPYDE